MSRIKKLFLCHFNQDASEIYKLAEELRLRGIIPWVDKQDGFQLGDSAPSVARNAIREECFGLLFYASENALDRSFIRRVELDEAIRVKDDNPDFMLIAVPRGMKFETLSKRSLEVLGEDLTKYHSIQVEGNNIEAELASLANKVVFKVLSDKAAIIRESSQLNLQISTRDCLPSEVDDVLCIDGSKIFAERSISDIGAWGDLQIALREVKENITKTCGRPRLRVHGSKHLTTAYILGRTFPASSGFKIDLRCGDEWWSTDVTPTTEPLLSVQPVDGSIDSDIIFVEVSATDKHIRDSVRQYEQTTGIRPHLYLQFRLKDQARRFSNSECLSMALQIRAELSTVASRYPVSRISIFSAIPQGMAMLLGHQLNAQKPIQLHEYECSSYVPSCII